MSNISTSGVKGKTRALTVDDLSEDEAADVCAQVREILWREDLKGWQKVDLVAALLGSDAPETLSPTKLYKRLEFDVWSKTDGHCTYCGVKLNPFDRNAINGFHMEHSHPQSRGGATDLANMVPACSRCNWSKHASTPEEWRAKRV